MRLLSPSFFLFWGLGVRAAGLPSRTCQMNLSGCYHRFVKMLGGCLGERRRGMRISDLNAQANSKGIKANPALEGLHRFVGEWEVELQFPTDPPGKVSGEASFEWLEEGAFLLERLGNS